MPKIKRIKNVGHYKGRVDLVIKKETLGDEMVSPMEKIKEKLLKVCLK
jgi:hypothetical protein